MTDGDSPTDCGIGKRHGPELGCVACEQTIPRDVTVVLVMVELRGDEAMLSGHTIGVTLDRHPGRVCEPCWEAAEPDADDPTWRRLADRVLARIGTGRRPYVLRRACEFCDRPVLLDVSRRRLAACSKRCQVYASQQRWPKPSREPLATRVCRCGTEFTPRRRDHEFCSHACRQAAYRAKRARARTG